MISSASANLVISVVKGTILAGRQIDQLLTLRTVNEGNIPGLSPPEAVDLSEAKLQELQRDLGQVLRELQSVLGDHDDQVTALQTVVAFDLPLGGDEAKWKPIVAQARIHLPDAVIGELHDSQARFVQQLTELRPDLAASKEWAYGAAFMLDNGDEDGEAYFQSSELVKRSVLIVLDQVFEIGAANADRVLSDPGGQKVLASVLRNLANEDLQDTADLSGKLILRDVLSATLGGVLDARSELKIRHEWIDLLLEGMAIARKKAGDDEGWKRYIGTLLSGKGYIKLVGSLIEAGADDILVEDLEPKFRKLAQSMLEDVATAMQDDPGSSLSGFLGREWSNLLRGFVEAVGEHGAEAAGIDDALAEALLKAVSTELVKGWNHGGWPDVGGDFFGSVIAAVGSNEALLEDQIKEAWLRDLVGALAIKVGDGGLSDVFDKGQLGPFVKGMIETSLTTLAESEELRNLLKENVDVTWLKPWVDILVDTLASDDLREIFTREGFAELSVDLIRASLGAAAENPALLDDQIREPWLKALIESLATSLKNASSRDVFTKKGLSELGLELARQLTASPRIIAELDNQTDILALQVVGEVLGKVDGSTRLAADQLATDLLTTALHAIADQPAALGTDYPKLVGSLAGALSKLSAAGWQSANAAAITESLLQASLLNPAVLLEVYPGVPGWVLKGIEAGLTSTLGTNPELRPLVDMLDDIVLAAVDELARHGKQKLVAYKDQHEEDSAAAELAMITELQSLLGSALPPLAAKVGDGLSIDDIPTFLSVVLVDWAGGPVSDAAVAATVDELITTGLS